MAKKIIIVGAGGLGREIASWMHSSSTLPPGSHLQGFLDDNPNALELYPYWKAPVLGSVQSYVPKQDEGLIMGIADPQTKLFLAEQLKERGASFLSAIHSSVLIADSARVGEGAVIYPFAIIHSDAVVGEFVTINGYSNVGHNSIVGRGTTLSGHVDITGGVKVGKGVFFGSNSSVIPEAEIGDFAKIGACSLAMKYVKPGVTVFGVPAKAI